MVRLKELASLVQAGDLEDLNFVVSKWHLKYRDVRVDNTPLLHLAVSSNQFSMVKFLLSQDVDIDALDQVRLHQVWNCNSRVNLNNILTPTFSKINRRTV